MLALKRLSPLERAAFLPHDAFDVDYGEVAKLIARSQRMSKGKLRLATRWSPRYRSVREGFPATIEAMRRESGRPRAEAA